MVATRWRRAADSILPDIDRAALHGDAGADSVTNLQGGVESVDGWLDDEGHLSIEVGSFAQMVDELVANLPSPPEHYQPKDPGTPLNGPVRFGVIQPP